MLNEIDGYDHSHSNPVGVPAIMGMNFQTVSTAEKLPTLDGTSATNSMAGGYLPGTNTPGPLLQRALNFINASLKSMDDEIHAQGLAKTTAIILSAKHGQSPIDPNALTRIDDGAIIKAINLAWIAKAGGGKPGRRGQQDRPDRRRGQPRRRFPAVAQYSNQAGD